MRRLQITTLLMLTLLFSSILLSACGAPSQNNNSTNSFSTIVPSSPSVQSVASTDWWQTPWANSTCKPPCWMGLTPGITSANEAFSVLSKTSNTNKLNMSPNKNKGVISGYWSDNNNQLIYTDSKFAANGEISYGDDSSASLIRYISLTLPSFKFENIINSYGSPDYVVGEILPVSAGRLLSYNIYILYLTQGIFVQTKIITDRNSPPNIDKTLPLQNVRFYIPIKDVTKIDGAGITIPQYKDLLVPWQGFNNFKFYCRIQGTRAACDL